MFPSEDWRLFHKVQARFCVALKKNDFFVFVLCSYFTQFLIIKKPGAGYLIAYLASERSVKMVEIAVAPT
jgi:hypothetical protein